MPAQKKINHGPEQVVIRRNELLAIRKEMEKLQTTAH